MGLINGPNSEAAKRGRIMSEWRIPTLLAICSLLAALAGDAGREWLRWDRDGLSTGQVWRTVTGHFVHLGWTHFLLNMCGLVLVWLIVGSRLGVKRWIMLIAASIVGMNLGFWFLDPELQWYVGMSGLLHALLLGGLIVGFRSNPGESALIAAFVVAKLVFEQVAGPLPGSESASGGAIIVNAHLYGSITATMVSVLFLIRVPSGRSI
jgi:rhomboid family GlyGly-CTERM serine protease